jgi:hypothetical protein
MFVPELYLFWENDTSANCPVANKRKDESGKRPFTSFVIAFITNFLCSIIPVDAGQKHGRPAI